MSRITSLVVVALFLTASIATGVTATLSTGTAPTQPTDSSRVDASRSSAVDTSHALAPADGHDARSTAPNNTTARLPLTGDRTGNYSNVDLDFGGTMAMSTERVESQYRVSLVSVQLDRVDSRAARDAVVNAYLDAAVDEIDALSTKEARVVDRYVNDEISAETLLVQLAIVDMRARAIQDSIGRIRAQSGSLSRETQFRLEDVVLELDGFTTGIREHVAQATAGDLRGQENPIYVTGSRDGVVLEMLQQRQYQRNAVRFDNRNADAIDRLGSIPAFENRLEEVYNWSYSLRTQPRLDTYKDRNLYTAQYRHPQGSLMTYVDGATTDVYREHQSFVLGQLPVADRTTRTTNNTTVEIVRTPRGGPFKVNVTRTLPDAEGNPTSVPVDAVVKVDGRVVDRTGDDGVLWVLAPVGDYEVTVEGANTTTNVSVGS